MTKVEKMFPSFIINKISIDIIYNNQKEANKQ